MPGELMGRNFEPIRPRSRTPRRQSHNVSVALRMRPGVGGSRTGSVDRLWPVHRRHGTGRMAAEERSGTTPVLVLRKFKQILESFTIDDPELTLQQITRSTGLPASTCQRLVHNLVREGFLDRYDDTYRVGLGLVRWAAPGTFGLDLVRLTRPVLQQLRDETGETACLYVRDGAYRTVISLAESRHPVVRLFVVGMVMPLHAGSAGKVFLAWDKLAVKDAIGH